MTPIQQMFLGFGAADKVYLDNVFSTYLYKGNATNNHHIQNSVDLTEGGLVWMKDRGSAENHLLVDSEYSFNNSNKYLISNLTGGGYSGPVINSFETNGFKLHSNWYANQNNNNYSSWTFRKAKGFFTIKEYSGSNSAQTLSHDLGCIPGLIIVKRTDSSGDWMVYHTSLGAANYAKLNTTVAGGAGSVWNSTSPTSTTFTVEGNNGFVNTSGGTFIAYLFAGGESTAATARSVEFHGGDDSLVIYNQADLSPEAGDFTCEMWVRPDSWSSGDSLVYASSSGFSIKRDGSNNTLIIGMSGSTTHLTSTRLPDTGVWTHVAVARSSGTMRLFFNGALDKEATVTHSYASPVTMYIVGGGGEFNGKISNFRFVKGTAVYTSSFKVPTEPLTNITNTKLLCCNSSSVTGSTVTPGTVTSGGPPDASTDSPFDDTAAYKFGDGGDQNIIKCGSHSNPVTENVRVYTGWEPQWVMVKNASASSNWGMFDCVRGMFVDEDSPSLAADRDSAENGVIGSSKFIYPHGDGFTMKYGATANNPGNGNTIVYIAIRRPDGYVGKPAEAGTDVFNIVTGNGSSNGPCFDSAFVVDFALRKAPGSTSEWKAVNRPTGKNHLETNSNTAETTHNDNKIDFSNGWGSGSIGSGSQSWIWKRGQGLDLVTWNGNSTAGHRIPHSLNKTPEMIWLKHRGGSGTNEDWAVYHKGLNDGTNPEQYGIRLDSNDPEYDSAANWNDTAPNSLHFTVGSDTRVNNSNSYYVAMLFASISGVSAVGSYDGTGSSNHSITTGFQPRFILIKAAHRADGYGGGWHIFATVRGIDSGNEYHLTLNSDAAQTAMNHLDYIDLDSDGFTIQSTSLSFNGSNARYIYYAHA